MWCSLRYPAILGSELILVNPAPPTNPARPSIPSLHSPPRHLAENLFASTSGRIARIDGVKLNGVLHDYGDSFDVHVSNDAAYSSLAQACTTGLHTGVAAGDSYSIDAVCSSETFGRYLFISLPGSEKTLQLCEVELLGDSPLVNWEWRILAQPTFTASFVDFAGDTLFKLEVECEDASAFCGYKENVRFTLTSIANGVIGSAETITSQGIVSTSNVMDIRVTADTQGFTLFWTAFEGTVSQQANAKDYAFTHRFPAGVQNFNEVVLSAASTNPTTPVVSKLLSDGAGGLCLPAEVDAVLPVGTMVYGGGSLVGGAFVTAVGGSTNTTFETSLTGEFTFTSYVKFSGHAEYSFYADCGKNSIVFSDPPKLVGCEFGDQLLSFSSDYSSTFRFSAGRRNGMLMVSVGGMAMVQNFAMGWAIKGMGWGGGDSTVSIMSMSASCDDPYFFLPVPPSVTCTSEVSYVCSGNLSSGVSVIDSRDIAEGGGATNICGEALRVGGFSAWTFNQYHVGISDVSLIATMAPAIGIGADFAFESVVLFESGLTPFVPWGVAFFFYEGLGGTGKGPYSPVDAPAHQNMFGFEWNYTWTQGNIIGSTGASSTVNRYETYESAPPKNDWAGHLSVNKWHTFTFLRVSGQLTVLVDGEWVLMQTVSYDSVDTISAVGWRTGRTSMRFREFRAIDGMLLLYRTQIRELH